MRRVAIEKQNINFEKYESGIKEYPMSYSNFKSFEMTDDNFLDRCIIFLKSNHIEISCYERTSGKYKGTFSTNVKIKDIHAVQLLGRKSGQINYHYFSSYEFGMRKGLLIGFELIERLLTGKEFPEKRRKSKKEI